MTAVTLTTVDIKHLSPKNGNLASSPKMLIPVEVWY